MTTKTNSGQDIRPSIPNVAARPAAPLSVPGLPVIDSRELFGKAQEIGIMHEGSLYRLKITRQGKLILNK